MIETHKAVFERFIHNLNRYKHEFCCYYLSTFQLKFENVLIMFCTIMRILLWCFFVIIIVFCFCALQHTIFWKAPSYIAYIANNGKIIE